LPSLSPDRVRGALLGAAVGDALGTPIEGLSHQNVRTYYRGIKGYRADEKRDDRAAGEGTHRTARTLALARALAEPSGAPLAEGVRQQLGGLALPRWNPEAARGSTGWAAASAAPLGVWAEASGASTEALLAAVREAFAEAFPHPAALAAAYGQAVAVRTALGDEPDLLDGQTFLSEVAEAAARAERHYGADGAASARLRALSGLLDAFPLDLQDACNGTGPASDEAWPFAVAMVARDPTLVEANLLSAVNVGSDAPTIGACLGALVGALHGWEAFPDALRQGLAARDPLAEAADRLAEGPPAEP
jgi:ADP-ribosyl-[dinitrogen reductase] hydrolase